MLRADIFLPTFDLSEVFFFCLVKQRCFLKKCVPFEKKLLFNF
jgi:hypothetical protein